MAEDTERRIGELEDEVKQRDRRIADLKQELEEERDLTHRLAEQVGDANDIIDTWIQAFEMVRNDEGVWVWSASFADGEEWLDKYTALLRQWNKFVPDYNAKVRPRNVGRPLAASEGQCAHVRKLHKAGKSLRWIAEETNLGLNTVRTIIAQHNGNDRTTIKHLSRIDPDRARVKFWKAKQRTRDALPKRIHELRKIGDELLKEVKGLGGDA